MPLEYEEGFEPEEPFLDLWHLKTKKEHKSVIGKTIKDVKVAEGYSTALIILTDGSSIEIDAEQCFDFHFTVEEKENNTEKTTSELEEEVVRKLLTENYKHMTYEENKLQVFPIEATLELCPKCEKSDLQVFQCDTGIWEVWAKCKNCGEIFCLGTE